MKKILVIDDSMTIVKSMEYLLKDLGYDVKIAIGSIEALIIFNAYHPDLVFLDIEMPQMNGYELLKKLKEKMTLAQQTVPVIMLTGKNRQDDVIQSIKLGATDYIVKPFDQFQVKLKVEKLLTAA